MLEALDDCTRRDVHQLFTAVDNPPGSWTLSNVQMAVNALVEQGLIEEIPKSTGAGFGRDRIEFPTVYIISQAGKKNLSEG